MPPSPPTPSTPSTPSKPSTPPPSAQRPRVRDLPAEAERGQARRPAPEARAERLGVPVLDSEGRRVGELTDAAVPFEEQVPRVVIGLDEDVRRRYRLADAAVDVEARFVRREADGTVRLTDPLEEILREAGFEL